MAYLYLIRHPLTKPDPQVPAAAWRLSNAGRIQVRELVAAPFWVSVCAVYTSDQHKAAVVGAAAAKAHGIPHHVVPALTEAARDRWLEPDAFTATQQRFFADPDQPPVESWESAHAAGERFHAAVNDVLAQHPPDQSVALIAHATVLTLYVAHLRGEPPSHAFWRTIGFATVLPVARATMQPIGRFCGAPYDL